MQRFLSKKDDSLLPTATSGQGDGMGSGKGPSLPKVKPMTLASWAWLSISIIMIVMGIKFAATSTNVRSLVCGAESCAFAVVSVDKDEVEDFTFPRHNLKSAQQVRVRQRQIRDVSKMSRKDIRKLGYSYSISFMRQGSDKIEEIALALTTLGRRRPGSMVEQISEYIDGDSTELDVRESSGFDMKGLVFILLGVVSCLFCVLLGQFSDPKPRRAASSRVTKKRAY